MSENTDPIWEKIAGKLHGELGPEEEAAFNEIIGNKTHLQEFEKSKRIARDLYKAGPVTLEEKAHSWKQVEKGIRTYRLKWLKTTLKYAAIIVVTLMAGNLMHQNAVENKVQYSEIFVPYGQMSQITLSDGTKIFLNSGTTLKYPDRFANKERTVEIVGEAYLKVAKLPGKPFIVKSNDLAVRVLGTSFNFSAYSEDATSSVTLVEGKVEVQNAEGKTYATLLPGQMLTKEKGANTFVTKNVKTDFYSSWSEGKIFFDDERLDQIAIKLERWFNVEISFADEKLKSRKFSGTILKNKPVDQIMQALELLSPITFKHEINTAGKDKITIYKRI